MLVMGSGWLHRALSVRARRVQRCFCLFDAGCVCVELDCWMNGTGVGCNDFVFLLEFGLAAMVFVLSGRDDDYACRFGSYQDLDCVASSLCFPLFSCVLEP